MGKKYFVFLVLGIFSLSLFFIPAKFFSTAIVFDDLADFCYAFLKKHTDAGDIVVVAVDEHTLRSTKVRWPLRRTEYAKLLDRLNAGGAKAVGFDIVFRGESVNSDDDKIFLQSLKDFNGKIILGYSLLNKANRATNIELEFQKYSGSGFLNVPEDHDGKIRRVRMRFAYKRFSDYSFIARLAAAFYGKDIDISGATAVIGAARIPLETIRTRIESNDGIIVNAISDEIGVLYTHRPQYIKTVSLYDVLEGKIPQDTFNKKLVLVGATAKIVNDIKPTPIGNIPGVYINANALANIFSGIPARRSPLIVSVLACAMLIFFTALCLLYFRSSWALLWSFALAGSFLAGNIALRSLGWQLYFGQIMTSLLSFVCLAAVANYVNFWLLIIKIQNRISIDPLTKLYNTRYFYERLNLESRDVLRRHKFFVLICLDGFEAFVRGVDFTRLQDIWNTISGYLFHTSKTWARYSENVILGMNRQQQDIVQIQRALEGYLTGNKGRVKVKIGFLKLVPDLESVDFTDFLARALRNHPQDIVEFDLKDIPIDTLPKIKPEHYSMTLFRDAEERNKELLESLAKVKEEEKKTKEAYLQLILSLINALESKDSYTKGHSQRVCSYAFMLADELKMADEEKDKVKTAALLHDLGKIGIPDTVLHKKGRLNPEEFAVIKEHALMGAKILEPIREFQNLVPYILNHHEDFDGGGYPQGLSGKLIPLGARIIAIADVFDALTTGRDYKLALSVKESVAELVRCKGRKFDPELVDIFIAGLRDLNMLPAE